MTQGIESKFDVGTFYSSTGMLPPLALRRWHLILALIGLWAILGANIDSIAGIGRGSLAHAAMRPVTGAEFEALEVRVDVEQDAVECTDFFAGPVRFPLTELRQVKLLWPSSQAWGPACYWVISTGPKTCAIPCQGRGEVRLLRLLEARLDGFNRKGISPPSDREKDRIADVWQGVPSPRAAASR